MAKSVQQKVCEMPLLSEQEYYHKLDNIVLSSLEHVRQIFRNRWKAETGDDWVDDSEHSKKFIEGAGKSVYKQARHFQKTVLEEQRVAEWDMSLLSFVIQNFGCKKKYQVVNAAVNELRTIRNDLAHSPTKKVTKEEYIKNVEIFTTSLLSLGMEKKNIEKIIELAGVTSSLKAVEYMNGLHEKAKELMVMGKTEEALKYFSESINVPSLLPVNLGTAHEKRAEYFLSQAKAPLVDQDKCSAALLDATKAIELNEYSWISHFLAAQCYRWQNELPKALHHYERALTISPAQEKVKDEYDICKLLAGEHNRGDHMNPVFMPMTLEELMEDLEMKTGRKVTKENFVEIQTLSAKTVKGQDHVFRGHQYLRGWEVPQKFSEAVKHFAKAAKLKNPEGIYNLAVCYQHGHGVKQDIRKALEMYREAAEMDKNFPRNVVTTKYNEGVISAQHALGLLYQEGVGVEQDYVIAAYWYKRAMENGVGHAANNLGHLYKNGQGMPQDEKMAEYCWKEAVNLRSTSAPASLMTFYREQMEPEKAADMLQIGRKLGNPALLKIPDDEFERHLAQIKSRRLLLEPEVLEFERTNKLSSKGLTFKERMARKIESSQPPSGKALKVMNRFLTKYKGEEESWGGQTRHEKFTHESIHALYLKAEQGSSTAFNITETLSLYGEILEHLSNYKEGNAVLATKIVDLLYNCVILEIHVISFEMTVMHKLKSIVQKLFEENGDKTGKEDMKIRLCYGSFNLSGSMKSDGMFAVEVLKEGIRRYPDNVHYYEHLSNIYGNKGMYAEGRFYAEEGLKLFPDNVDLLYALGSHLRNQCLSNKTTAADCFPIFKKFITLAPKDHRKVPEAYYQISMSLLVEFYFKKQARPVPAGVFEQIKAYFDLAQGAEKYQLPCYLPYGGGDGKDMVQSFLLEHEKDLGSSSSPTSSSDGGMEMGILQKKPYLLAPARKSIILAHREHMKKIYRPNLPENLVRILLPLQITAPPKLKQTVAGRMPIRPIHLHEMNPTEDQIYEDRILELTITDELNPFYPSINLIGEDENGEMTRLYVYNVGRSKDTLAKFQPGCRIGIVNPYMRIGAVDDTHGIRNDEPKCIVFLQKIKNICRFCGEKDAAHKCSKCKRPYCSRECQILDWNELKHKLICSLKL